MDKNNNKDPSLPPKCIQYITIYLLLPSECDIWNRDWLAIYPQKKGPALIAMLVLGAGPVEYSRMIYYQDPYIYIPSSVIGNGNWRTIFQTFENEILVIGTQSSQYPVLKNLPSQVGVMCLKATAPFNLFAHWLPLSSGRKLVKLIWSQRAGIAGTIYLNSFSFFILQIKS